MKKILVLGKNGQLGSALKSIQDDNQWTFLGRDDLDLSKTESILGKLNMHDFDILINCAAFTAVDDAEENNELAFKINAEALGPISLACCEKNATLFHISTDYVFGNTDPTPLSEDHQTNPTGIYGKTKLKGEQTIKSICPNHYIIRTSWLYGTGNQNFLNTMLKLSENRNELNVVFDQVGSPTFVNELAKAILSIISDKSENYGVYHFSNEGVCSWYDFAIAIFEMTRRKVKVRPVLSNEFPTKATRPNYSVLNKKKIRDTFGIQIPHWQESLNDCLDLKHLLNE